MPPKGCHEWVACAHVGMLCMEAGAPFACCHDPHGALLSGSLWVTTFRNSFVGAQMVFCSWCPGCSVCPPSSEKRAPLRCLGVGHRASPSPRAAGAKQMGVSESGSVIFSPTVSVILSLWRCRLGAHEAVCFSCW